MPGGGTKRPKRDAETSNKAKEAGKDLKRTNSKKKGESESEESNEEYEVEFIEGHKVSKDNETVEFFVRWKNYPPSDNTYEGFEFFAHDAPGLAQQYLAKLFNLLKFPKNIKDIEVYAQEEMKKRNDYKDGSKKVPTTAASPLATAAGMNEEITSDTKIRIISQFEYGTEESKMGFLIEIQGSNKKDVAKRDLISEDELLKTHSKEMYNFLKSTLRFEVKVPVKKSLMLSHDFDDYLQQINKGGVPTASNPSVEALSTVNIQEGNIEEKEEIAAAHSRKSSLKPEEEEPVSQDIDQKSNEKGSEEIKKDDDQEMIEDADNDDQSQDASEKEVKQVKIEKEEVSQTKEEEILPNNKSNSARKQTVNKSAQLEETKRDVTSPIKSNVNKPVKIEVEQKDGPTTATPKKEAMAPFKDQTPIKAEAKTPTGNVTPVTKNGNGGSQAGQRKSAASQK